MSAEHNPTPIGADEVFSLYDITVDQAYAAYDRFRGGCPVAKSDALGGYFSLTRYSDVREAAKAWEKFSSAQGVDLPKLDYREAAITTDPPLHDEYRALMREVLNQKTINALEPYATGIAHQLMDAFADAGSCDLVGEFTEQIPPTVICRIVGLDAELALEMREVSIRLGDSWDSPEAFAAALSDFRGFVLPQVELRRDAPRADYLTRLATQPFRGSQLSDDAIVQIMVGFLLAGHESTTAAMSSALFHLLSRRDRVATVLDDTQRLSTAIEEALRLNTPFHHFRRTTTGPVEIGGATLPEGAHVMLNYAAANRDETVFPDPHEFMIDRRPNPHVAFGFGVHTCVGGPLARMELRVAIRELLSRFPDLTLAVDPASVRWRFLGGNLAFIPSLPAVFSPRER